MSCGHSYKPDYKHYVLSFKITQVDFLRERHELTGLVKAYLVQSTWLVVLKRHILWFSGWWIRLMSIYFFIYQTLIYHIFPFLIKCLVYKVDFVFVLFNQNISLLHERCKFYKLTNVLISYYMFCQVKNESIWKWSVEIIESLHLNIDCWKLNYFFRPSNRSIKPV